MLGIASTFYTTDRVVKDFLGTWRVWIFMCSIFLMPRNCWQTVAYLCEGWHSLKVFYTYATLTKMRLCIIINYRRWEYGQHGHSSPLLNFTVHWKELEMLTLCWICLFSHWRKSSPNRMLSSQSLCLVSFLLSYSSRSIECSPCRGPIARELEAL